MELELINFEFEFKFPPKKNEYFFHDNPTWNIIYSEKIPGETYSW